MFPSIVTSPLILLKEFCCFVATHLQRTAVPYRSLRHPYPMGLKYQEWNLQLDSGLKWNRKREHRGSRWTQPTCAKPHNAVLFHSEWGFCLFCCCFCFLSRMQVTGLSVSPPTYFLQEPQEWKYFLYFCFTNDILLKKKNNNNCSMLKTNWLLMPKTLQVFLKHFLKA